MRKIIGLLIAIILIGTCAIAETQDVFTLWFEDGFSLSIPEGWVCYPVDDDSMRDGIRYILGDADGSQYMYIQRQTTTIADSDALGASLESQEGYQKTSNLTFDDQQFLAFIVAEENLSACVTLYEDDLLTFMFTPQSNSSYMLTATEIMQSFTLQNSEQ